MQGLGDPEFGDKCLHMTLEVWAMKEKQLISWTSLKFKTFALWKTFLGKEKDIHILGENIKKKKNPKLMIDFGLELYREHLCLKA